MGQWSNYAEDKVLDHVLKNSAYNRPTNLYLALCTATVTDSNTGSTITEPSGGSYAREVVDDYDVSAARATANSVQIDFTEATASWGTVTYWAICDALTAGNMIAYGQLTAPKTITTGDNYRAEIGDLDLNFVSGGSSTYLANELLDHVFTDVAYAQPTSIFVGLATSTIVDADTGATVDEPADTYVRINADSWDASSGGASANPGLITFATATVGYGTVTDFFLTDASTTGEGNILFYAALETSRAIGASDIPEFAIGALDITMG